MRERAPIFIVLAGLIFLTAGPGLAGPNAGGTLIVHQSGYQDRYHSPACGASNLTNCQDAVTTSIVGDVCGGYNATPIWYVMAAFPPGSSPRLKGMTFGIDYDPYNLSICTDWAVPCIGSPNNGAMEFPGAGWPGPDTGTSVIFESTQTGLLVEVYMFLGYSYYGNPTTFRLTPHPDPVLGGQFGDDSVPARLDPIAAYSTLGFGMPGELNCPVDPAGLAEPSVPVASGVSVQPNPTSGPCRIDFNIPVDGAARIDIVRADGRVVRRLAGGSLARGARSTSWDGCDGRGARVPAGVYLARVLVGNAPKVERVVVVR